MRFQPRWFGEPIKSEYLTDRLGANPDGVLAEYAVFNEEAVVALPSHLSFEGAATLPCAAVTAWVALTGHRRYLWRHGDSAFQCKQMALHGVAISASRANFGSYRFDRINFHISDIEYPVYC